MGLMCGRARAPEAPPFWSSLWQPAPGDLGNEVLDGKFPTPALCFGI